jgi:cysteine desulfuration protein SufE
MSYGEGNWPEPLQLVIEEFSDVFDDMERYEMLYEFASECDLLSDEFWCEETRVHGCQSEAHIICSLNEDGTFKMVGSADAQIVQGLMAIAQKAVNGLPPSDVADFPVTFTRELGLMNSLSPNRANGFLNMFTRVRQEARKLAEA